MTGADALDVICTECSTEYQLTTDNTNDCPDCGFVAWEPI
jgi:Zn finger protein HypA/HybF involved in hydrogenase expression